MRGPKNKNLPGRNLIGSQKMTSLFDSSRRKVKRAEKHIDDLIEALKPFYQVESYQLAMAQNPDTGRYYLRFSVLQEMPSCVPLILGDAIHNLRSSLDIAICDLVRAVGDTVTTSTKFPFAKDKGQASDVVKRGPLPTAAPTVATVLIDELKPFPGGDDELYAVDQLDIADKHRLILPVVTVTILDKVTGVLVNRHGGRWHMRDDRWHLGEGRVLDMAELDGPFEFEITGEPWVGIMFGSGQPLEKRPVVQSMQAMAKLIADTLDRLEQAAASDGIQ